MSPPPVITSPGIVGCFLPCPSVACGFRFLATEVTEVTELFIADVLIRTRAWLLTIPQIQRLTLIQTHHFSVSSVTSVAKTLLRRSDHER